MDVTHVSHLSYRERTRPAARKLARLRNPAPAISSETLPLCALSEAPLSPPEEQPPTFGTGGVSAYGWEIWDLPSEPAVRCALAPQK